MNPFLNKKFLYINFERSSFEGGFGNGSSQNESKGSSGDHIENGFSEGSGFPELTAEEIAAIEAAQKASVEEMRKLAEAGFGEKLVRSEGIEPQGREEVAEALRKAIEEVRKGE